MKKLFPSLSLIVILVSLISLVIFRQIPSGESGTLWKGFSVLYVPQNVSEESVILELNKAGIDEYTCLSNQYLPVDLSKDSLEVTLLPYNAYSMDYLTKRNNFFFDKSHSYKLYYVPVSYKNRLSVVQNNLSGCGVDTTSTYPYLFPLLTFIFAILLTLFCRKKAFYGALCVLPVLYTLSFPYLSSVISAFIVLTVFFTVANLFGRRDFVSVLLKKYVFYFLLGLAFISTLSSGLAPSIIFVLIFVSEFGIICLYRFIKIVTYRHSRFSPVMIRSSSSIPVFSGKENLIFSVLLMFTLICFVFSLLSFNVSSGNQGNINSKGVMLPSVSSIQKSEDLPQLEDFYQWDYIVRTFPERSLNETSSYNFNPLSPVVSKNYQSSGTGISEFTSEFMYNQEYKDSVYAKIDLLPFNAFEKIMKKQGEDFQAGFSSSGSYRLSLFCIIISFIQFSVILFYFAWILVNKKSKGRGRK